MTKLSSLRECLKTVVVAVGILLATLALVLAMTTNSAGAIPIDPILHLPPAVKSNHASVMVDEGQAAINTGTYQDDLDDDPDTVSITASVGTVTKTGTDFGDWNWSFQTTDGPSESQTVFITARDSTGRSKTVSFTLTVNNVAPTATFNAVPDVVKPGDAFGIRSSDQFDPSSKDTAARFRYQFDCGSGNYDLVTSADNALCFAPFVSSLTVRGKILDKDGDFTERSQVVKVDAVAPTIDLVRPVPGSKIKDRTPTIRAMVRDDVTELAASNISLIVDGQQKSSFAYDQVTDRLSFTTKRLSLGRHSVKIEARDQVGHVATRAWKFRVVR